jgi:hypothetical protein
MSSTKIIQQSTSTVLDVCENKSQYKITDYLPQFKKDAFKDVLKQQLKSGSIVEFVSSLNLSHINDKIIEGFQAIVNEIGILHVFTVPEKLIIPELPEIEDDDDDDTAEIEKYIRKINYKTQTFRCDHNKFDKNVDRFQAEVGKIYLSKEYKELEQTLNNLVDRLYRHVVKQADNYYDVLGIYSETLKKAKLDTIAINNKLIELESQYKSIKCVKCDKINAEYEYSLKQINQTRSKLKKRSNAGERVDLITFVNNILNEDDAGDRIPLTDIQNRYKTLTKINITQDEMKMKLQDHFFIINLHNKLFLSKK